MSNIVVLKDDSKVGFNEVYLVMRRVFDLHNRFPNLAKQIAGLPENVLPKDDDAPHQAELDYLVHDRIVVKHNQECDLEISEPFWKIIRLMYSGEILIAPSDDLLIQKAFKGLSK